jgi:hypothetical protein
LDLGVAGLLLLNESVNGGDKTPGAPSLASVIDNREQGLPAFLDLGLGRALPSYVTSLISGGGPVHAALREMASAALF